jgi:hypothetical protein
MINAGKLVVSILGIVLVAAPLLRAEDVKPSEGKVIVAQLPALPELGLQPQRPLRSSLPGQPLSMPAMGLPDLSHYRGFHFGETLLEVAKQAGLEVSEARLIHERPAVIQELTWPIRLASSSSSPQVDPVQTILFSFYDGQLFRIVVTYDRDETKKLTLDGMIKAISAEYGTVIRPARTKITFSSTQVYNDSEAVIARWEDAQYSFNLFRSTYQPTFGMIAFSKKLDALARTATAEAIRLDALGVPQREIERQNNSVSNLRRTQPLAA